jgi:hypothetical protein
MACVQAIFTMLDCDHQANLELLGNNGVTEINMMTYLGIIE